MPLTEYQKGVARVIAANRTPESHIAGGIVINRGESSPRRSDDFDIFHDAFAGGRDAAVIVAESAAADERSLTAAGYSLEWALRRPGLVKAVVSRGGEGVRLDWVADSVYRFFPVQKDDEFGYCLHPADLAVNKALALVGRVEVRDLIDIIQIDQNYLSFGAIVWAACGKDEGYTPSLILEMTDRHSRFTAGDLARENLVGPIDLKELKRHWLGARARAESLLPHLPGDEVGCLYLDAARNPVTPDPAGLDFRTLTRHRVSAYGAWPTFAED